MVEDPSGTVGIADNTLTLSGGIEMRPAIQDLTISSAVALGAAQEWSVGAGTDPGIQRCDFGILDPHQVRWWHAALRVVSPMTGGIVVDEGTVELNGGGWYAGYVGGSGMLTVNDGATAINMVAHAFGNHPGPSRDLSLNGGRFRLQKETYVDDIWMTAGIIDNTAGSSSDLRARSGSGTVLTVNPADDPSVIDCQFNFYSNATFNVIDGAADPDLLVSGPMVGGGTLTKGGVGRMTLSGISSHTGDVDITAGSVAVTGLLALDSDLTVGAGALLEGTGTIEGFVSNGGTVSPGLGGVAVLSVGTYEQLPGATTEIELNGINPGSGHDQLAVTRSATLAGLLDVTLVPGFTPGVGDSFTLLSCGSRVGIFGQIDLPNLPGDRRWVTTYDPAGGSGLEI